MATLACSFGGFDFAAWSPVVIPLFAGILGASLGAWLTTRRQQRNWQLQRAVESFACLDQAGQETLWNCRKMKAGVSNAKDLETAKQKHQIGVERLGLWWKSDSRRYLSLYHLYERNGKLRALADQFGKRLVQYLDHVIGMSELGLQEREHGADQTKRNAGETRAECLNAYEAKQGPDSEQLLKDLESLKDKIAKKYLRKKWLFLFL